MIKYLKLYDLVGFKICWVLCAFCSTWNQPYLGPFVTLIFLLIHLYLVNFKSRDVKVILIAIACGFILDSSFSLLGLISTIKEVFYLRIIYLHYGFYQCGLDFLYQ